MKRARKLTAVMLAICLMIPWCTTLTVTADVNPQPQTAVRPKESDEPFRFGRSILEQMDNSEALLYAYDQLVSGCETLSSRVDIFHRTHQLNAEEASLVWEVITSDYPAFFWLVDGVSIRSSGGVVTSYGLSVPADAAAQMAAIDARVAELTADLADKSDYEKSLILHNRLADINTYQFTANDQTIIGSLLEGQSVCAGYARAYQLLMQAVGIPVFYVTGHSKGQGHAWNLVQLDGEWYYTDVTWDDQNDDGGAIYYAYFNLTYEQMCEDHTAVEFAEYLPRTTATAANYHVRHDTMMDLPTGEIIATLYEADLPIRLYMTGDLNAFFAELNNALYDAADRVACIGSGFSCSMTYLGREIIIDLSISRPHNYDSKNVCQKCGYQKVENHHYVITVIDPTCANKGRIIYTCSYCEKSYFEYIPATGEHTYETVVTEPNCVHGGYTTYTCTVCGDSYDTDFIPSIEHNYEAVTTDPTCAESGLNVYTCIDCSYSFSEPIPPTGEHSYETVVTEPDCVNGGYTTHTCTVCGDNYTTDPVPATGKHVYDSDLDPDCNVCGEKRNVTVPGDADGNGKVNNRDLGLLLLYLNDGDLSGKVFDVIAMDMDGNGKLNNRDLGLLQKLLNV